MVASGFHLAQRPLCWRCTSSHVFCNVAREASILKGSLGRQIDRKPTLGSKSARVHRANDCLNTRLRLSPLKCHLAEHDSSA